METLFAKQDRLLSLTSTEIIRTLMYQINWDAQLVAIKGPRGVGKTTLMLQYMKQHYEVYSREALLYAGLCLFLQSYFVGVGGCVCEKWREASLLGRGT